MNKIKLVSVIAVLMGVMLVSSGCGSAGITAGYSYHTVNKDGVNPCREYYNSGRVGLMGADPAPVCSPKTCAPVVTQRVVPVQPPPPPAGYWKWTPTTPTADNGSPANQAQFSSYQLPQRNAGSDSPVLVSARVTELPPPGQIAQEMYRWKGGYWIRTLDSNGQRQWIKSAAAPQEAPAPSVGW